MDQKRFLAALAVLIGAAILLGACNSLSNELVSPGSIVGRVYFDQNADQACEACECGIEYVKIRLYEDACSGNFVQTRYTDDEGFFTFEDLEPKTYCVKSDLPVSCDGFLPTTTTNQTVILKSGEQVELEWFGYESYIESFSE